MLLWILSGSYSVCTISSPAEASMDNDTMQPQDMLSKEEAVVPQQFGV